MLENGTYYTYLAWQGKFFKTKSEESSFSNLLCLIQEPLTRKKFFAHQAFFECWQKSFFFDQAFFNVGKKNSDQAFPPPPFLSIAIPLLSTPPPFLIGDNWKGLLKTSPSIFFVFPSIVVIPPM